MTASRVRRLAAISLCIAFASFMSVPRADTPAAPGDLWEVTSRMSMEGMPMTMPARKMKVCAAKDWTRPPGGDDSDRGCTSSDMMTEGDTVTWTSVCRDGMTGRGEITRNGDDAYTGTLRYASDQGDVLISYEGHKIGECDHPQ